MRLLVTGREQQPENTLKLIYCQQNLHGHLTPIDDFQLLHRRIEIGKQDFMKKFAESSTVISKK